MIESRPSLLEEVYPLLPQLPLGLRPQVLQWKLEDVPHAADVVLDAAEARGRPLVHLLVLVHVAPEGRGGRLPVGDERGHVAFALGLLHRPHQRGKEREGEVLGGGGLLAEQGQYVSALGGNSMQRLP